MIRLTCPGCQSRLNAKEELIGQTRKCPKCGADIVIADPAAAPEPDMVEPLASVVVPPLDAEAVAPLESIVTIPEPDTTISVEEPLTSFRGPERLTRLNQYLICSNTAVVAAWQNNGHGWALLSPNGLISAARNYEKIPTSGAFQLVELQMQMIDDALRLEGLFVYRLANRWSLLTLNKGDDAIVAEINALGSLNREQKAAVRQYLRGHVMRAIWENAETVLEYLASVDYHSPGVPVATTGDPTAMPTTGSDDNP